MCRRIKCFLSAAADAVGDAASAACAASCTVGAAAYEIAADTAAARAEIAENENDCNSNNHNKQNFRNSLSLDKFLNIHNENVPFCSVCCFQYITTQ